MNNPPSLSPTGSPVINAPTIPDLRTEVSVVVPAFNEAENLRTIVSALERILRQCASSFEILIVDDGSRDQTEAILSELSATFNFVRGITLSRNFGKEAAMGAGLQSAEGDCIIFIDADLQHPPELISEMLSRWRTGTDVVNAVKRNRGRESYAYRAFAGAFNGIMSSAIGADVRDASDYKLIDRQVASALLACPERNRFFRGLVAWVGFREENLLFDVQERNFGTTKWGLVSLARYSLRNVVAFSSLPLIGVAYTGFFAILMGMLLLLQTLYNYASGHALSGFTTVIVVQILLSGMILFGLGIIAIYIARMYEEQKSRPLFLIRTPRQKDQ